jgi:hypothetical protein
MSEYLSSMRNVLGLLVFAHIEVLVLYMSHVMSLGDKDLE